MPNIFQKFKLPDMQIFKSSDKNVSPYDNLHRWAAKKLFSGEAYKVLYAKNDGKLDYPKLCADKNMTVSDFWLCKEDSEKLNELVLEWIKNYHTRSISRAINMLKWHDLERGPVVFEDRYIEGMVEEPKLGYIYIRSK